MITGYAEATGPSWGRPGGFRVPSAATRAAGMGHSLPKDRPCPIGRWAFPVAKRRQGPETQNAKTPSESRSAMQRLGYVVLNVTGLPRQVPTAVASTGA